MKNKMLPNLYSFRSDKGTTTLPERDYIYVLGTDDGLIKIGTTNNLWGRIKNLERMSSNKLEPLMFWICQNGRLVEAALHTLFRDYRKHGEWFDFGHYDYNSWKYRHLALSALLTCSQPPIPIHGSILHTLQYEHIPTDDPIHDEPGGGDWSGKECYPSELFAAYYPAENDTFRLLKWSDEIFQLYDFS